MKYLDEALYEYKMCIRDSLLFTGLAFWAFSEYQFGVIEEQYGIEDPTYKSPVSYTHLEIRKLRFARNLLHYFQGKTE